MQPMVLLVHIPAINIFSRPGNFRKTVAFMQQFYVTLFGTLPEIYSHAQRQGAALVDKSQFEHFDELI
jgi:hypothetical protein